MSERKPMFLRPLHVVHIDSDDAGLNMVTDILTALTYPNFNTHSFSTIAVAQDWIGTNLLQVDCVLMNLQLICTVGIEAFMRSIMLFSSVPVLVLTDVDDLDLACNLVMYGADSYIPMRTLEKHLPFCIGVAAARRYRPVIPSVNDLRASLEKLLPKSLKASPP